MKTAHELVMQAKASIREVAPDEAAQWVARGALLLDVREPDEYRTARVKGAVNVPRGMLEFRIADVLEGKPSDAPLCVYCKTGGRAALAAQTLQVMGYTQIISIAGGIDGLANSPLPIERESLPDFE
ncbi:sulfurtransferase [Burkholderiaceae bacterium DAT-1]|nr:sulfurtransferase [Burkholderiaceae bacterium DAT-1]